MREYKEIKEFRNTDAYKQNKEENKDYIIDKHKINYNIFTEKKSIFNSIKGFKYEFVMIEEIAVLHPNDVFGKLSLKHDNSL